MKENLKYILWFKFSFEFRSVAINVAFFIAHFKLHTVLIKKKKFQPSTMENLAIFIWQSVKQDMDEPELLHEVKLTDNEQNCVVYNGIGGYVERKGQTLLTSDTD